VTDFFTALVNFLDHLIQPGNWPFLLVFTLVLVGMAVIIIASVRKESLDKTFKLGPFWKFGPLWIHLRNRPEAPKPPPRRFSKLLYVKVNHLANRKTQTLPFYERTVARLAEPERKVPVFDEAVYYTLKQFPEKRPQGLEEESSTGVVDPRLLIPWLDQVEFNSPQAEQSKSLVEIKTKADSDTMLSVSHFLNGLQGCNQDFGSYADEDAESLRLVVDFSSIPNAGDFIKMEGAELMAGKQPVQSDTLSVRSCGDSVYVANCRDVKKGSLLTMRFTFKNWETSPGKGAVST
jgi:hypothetical protein